jgi:putative ABC transport system permease protein
MLIARQAVEQKINDVKSSIGNTIQISPAGFSGFSQVNNSLTTTELSKVSSLAHVTNLQENLTDRLTTIGSSQPSFGFGNSNSNSNATTSLTSPIKLNTNSTSGNGPSLFISGGGSLPTNFSLPITMIGTTGASSIDGNTITISSGQTIDRNKDVNDALISTSMASKNNLKVGSTFTAYGATLTVTGIFNGSDTSALGGDVIVSLATEQSLSGQTGDVTSAIAMVDSLDNLDSVTSAISSQLGSSANVTSAETEADNTVKPLQNVESISMISLIGAIIAGSVIILLTMVMIVRERRREIGVLKAIGASNLRVIFQFMVEAVTLTLAGAVIGIIIGVIGGSPVTNALVSNSTNASTSTTVTAGPGGGASFRTGGGSGFKSFTARSTNGGGLFSRGGNSIANSFHNIQANVGWSILVYGLASALVIAILGSSLAGWMIARVRPSEVMRTE